MLNKNKIEYFLLIFLSKILNLFGIGSARYFGKVIAFIIFYLIPIRKKTVISNLKIAFPEYSEKEINNIAFRNYCSFAVMLIEFMCLPNTPKEEIINLVEVNELDKISENYERGNGVFLLTAHFGNWEIAGAYVSAKLGFPINVLAKDQSNPFVTNWLNTNREKLGNNVIKLGVSVKEIFMALHKGEIIAVVGDQRGPKESLRVNFFNKPTAVYPGTAAIAIKNNSPIIVGIIQRQKNNKYFVHLEDLKIDEITGSDEDKIAVINQRYMSILEKHIRETPEQWFWMHNIWKY